MLQIVLIFIGIYGLWKKKIRISKKRELGGKSVVYLSIFYLVMAAISFFIPNSTEGFSIMILGIFIIVIVTLSVVIFTKGKSSQSPTI